MKAMAGQRSHSIEFKRQIAKEFVAGETLYALAKRYDVSRNLIRVWVKKLVATTDSDHDYPIFPDLTRDKIVDGPNQLWVADITYIAIATGFVYLAAVLDA